MTTTTPIDRTFVPKLAKKAKLRFDRHSNSHMIIYPERGLALNESAAEIAKRLDGTRSIELIAKDLALTSNGDEESIVPDVIAFVQQLADKGLLER